MTQISSAVAGSMILNGAAPMRVVLDGDAALDGWRAQRGLDALIEEAE